MPASGAAPLPRLGEVFFDVRGDSRSMRLSWYADTGIAVFSIWQGGMCTGTFRLPMEDLSRMIEILQRGPQSKGGRPRSAPEDRRPAPPQAPAGYGSADPDATQFSIDAMPDAGQYGQPSPALAPVRGPAGRGADYHAPGFEPGSYDPAGYEPEGYDPASYEPGSHESGRYEDGRYEAGSYEPGSYEPGSYEPGSYEPGRSEPGGYQTGGYETGGYPPAGYQTGGHDPRPAGRPGDRRPGYPSAEYPDRDFPAGSHWPADGGYQPDATGQQRFGEPRPAGDYPPDRFVPPYVGPRSPSYLNDNLAAGSDSVPNDDPHAYPGDRQDRASAPREYLAEQGPSGGYFDRPDYLLTADPSASARHSAARNTSQDRAPAQPEELLPAAWNREPGPDYRGR